MDCLAADMGWPLADGGIDGERAFDCGRCGVVADDDLH
jgi:hypothetical protein